MSALERGVLFVLGSKSHAQGGPMPAWFNAACWASAARDLLGNAWMLTLEGVFSPDEARQRASAIQADADRVGAAWRRHLPLPLRTAYKDLRQAVRARRFRTAGLSGPWIEADLAFVWQRHDLFYRTGHVASHHFGCPLVLFVAAPRVWEDRQWGLRRPGWSRLLESLGEDRQLRSADLVACVSDTVAAEVARRGVREERLLVTPGAADLSLFTTGADDRQVRRRYGLEGKRVVGWVGSFRGFHGLDLAVAAVRTVQEQVPDVALLLVGDGAQRPAIEQLCQDTGIEHCIFTGTVAHDEVAAHIAAMDVALVLANKGASFHYSPLKLREYLACGVPVIAPRVGELTHAFQDGEELLLVPPGDPTALATAIHRVLTDPSLASGLATLGTKAMAAQGSCERQVRRVLEALDRLPPRQLDANLSLDQQ